MPEVKNVLFDVSNFPNGAKIVNTALLGQHNILVTGGVFVVERPSIAFVLWCFYTNVIQAQEV